MINKSLKYFLFSCYSYSSTGFPVNKKLILLLFFLLTLFPAKDIFSQNSYSPRGSRILILLDGSGSMKGKWDNETKFDIAKRLLLHVVDSIEKANPKVEFGLRVFGHQYPRGQMNCTDSKLELPFAKKNFVKLKTILEKIHPQGQTPIAYSLLQALNDFPKDSLSTNSIILITDGIETCNGNPCNVAKEFESRRISLKPFIVGLGIEDSSKHYFDCLGAFYDVTDSYQFTHVMGSVVSQALNNTTVQINLLNAYGAPSETNVSMTLYDHYSRKPRYNYIHTINAQGNPDTLRIDPIGNYDLIVHSIPPVEKKNIELVPGIHNTIALDVPRGELSLDITGSMANLSPIQCLVRETGKQNILYVQDFNTSQKYLVGDYDLEILTLPRIIKYGVKIEQSKTNSIKIPSPGTLNVVPTQLGVATLFILENNVMKKVYDFYSIKSTASVQVQPGKYIVVFRPDKGKQAILTTKTEVVVYSNKTAQVKL